ncbi:MAG: VCBS repeat-containing protein, partial [Hymenobacter sp.]
MKHLFSHFFLFQPQNRPRLGLLGGSLLLGSTALGQTFSPLASYPAASGGAPQAVTTGDFNNDGRRDVALANYSGHSVSVLLGQSNGTLGTATTYSSGASGYPQGVAAADLNGDGRADLVVANSNTNTLGVLLAQANGTFGAVTTYAAGTYTSRVAIGDVNGDGRPDLVATGTRSNNLLVLLGTGTGSFNAAVGYPTGNGAADVALADINGDGRLDAVVANSDANTVSVLLGQANGTLGSITNYSAGYTPYRVGLADIDADGRLDLVVLALNGNSQGVWVLRGLAGGTFAAATTAAFGPDGSAQDLALGDVNLDGRSDAIVAKGYGNLIEVYLGQANGSLGTYNAINTGSGTSPSGVKVADANGDGKLDIITANYNNNTAGVLLNTTVVLTPPAVTSASRCGAGTVTLQASGAVTGGSYRWYTVATGGTALSGATGSSYTTPTLYGTTTYYVSAVDANGANETTRTAVT